MVWISRLATLSTEFSEMTFRTSEKINSLHIYKNIQQHASVVSRFYCKISLHVSGTLRTHNQEQK
jgi:hypothetical protein